MILIIIANTFCLSMDKYPIRDQTEIDNLQLANQVFTFLFTAEVLIKLVGLGFKNFFSQSFNRFDFVIVMISIVEMEMASSSGVFSALRAFRLFKIFKLFKVGDLRVLLDSISFTVIAIGDYCILLGLFIYVFALIGMSFFAGSLKFNEDDEYDVINGISPRNNYDEILWSLVTVFQILLGEGWNLIMYNAIRGSSNLASLYFILLVITGNIIMLNLFLAILLGNFEKARNFG
jgi:hypothetical protein